MASILRCEQYGQSCDFEERVALLGPYRIFQDPLRSAEYKRMLITGLPES